MNKSSGGGRSKPRGRRRSKTGDVDKAAAGEKGKEGGDLKSHDWHKTCHDWHNKMDTSKSLRRFHTLLETIKGALRNFLLRGKRTQDTP